MQIIQGKDTALLAPFCVYTVDPSSWGKKSIVKRFLGCGFPCSSNGIIVTCNHVIQDLQEDEILVVQQPTDTNCHRAKILGRHSKFDIAFLKIDSVTTIWASPIKEELFLASDVWACGYYDSIIENGQIETIPQAFSGTITATPRKDFGLLTGLPFYQLSFPSLPGFSGSPLFYDAEGGSLLCGMLFENRFSKVVVRTIDEYVDGKMHFIEKSVREWESGIAHTAMTIQKAANDLHIDIWGESSPSRPNLSFNSDPTGTSSFYVSWS